MIPLVPCLVLLLAVVEVEVIVLVATGSEIDIVEVAPLDCSLVGNEVIMDCDVDSVMARPCHHAVVKVAVCIVSCPHRKEASEPIECEISLT